jgi:hypothetical protein
VTASSSRSFCRRAIEVWRETPTLAAIGLKTRDIRKDQRIGLSNWIKGNGRCPGQFEQAKSAPPAHWPVEPPNLAGAAKFRIWLNPNIMEFAPVGTEFWYEYLII